jgi:hypothetical protein
MNDPKKVFVGIYCKIYTDNFSDEMINVFATGQQIYDFLIKDAGQCFCDNGKPIPGDCNLWYLGCNEKFGQLVLDDNYWYWSFGESSFDTVEAFVSELYERQLISKKQFQTLINKICEGRRIDNMYDIRNYLVFKRLKIPWVKRSDCSNFRDDIKKIVGEVESLFRYRGYQFYKIQ